MVSLKATIFGCGGRVVVMVVVVVRQEGGGAWRRRCCKGRKGAERSGRAVCGLCSRDDGILQAWLVFVRYHDSLLEGFYKRECEKVPIKMSPLPISSGSSPRQAIQAIQKPSIDRRWKKYVLTRKRR